MSFDDNPDNIFAVLTYLKSPEGGSSENGVSKSLFFKVFYRFSNLSVGFYAFTFNETGSLFYLIFFFLLTFLPNGVYLTLYLLQ